MEMQVKIKKLNSETKLPSYAHPGDAGLDLYSLEDYVLKPGERHIFALGFALEFPPGFVALVWDKGSISFKYGIHTIGGVFDSNFRGEYKIMLINLSKDPYEFKKYDKIAQLLIQPVQRVIIEEVEELTETERNAGAFGSTGKK
jgi:dUTP pyrophosphatase